MELWLDHGMEPQKTKKPNKPGQLPFTWGILLLVIGGILAVVNLSTTNVRYVGGSMIESQGAPSAAAIVLIIAGVILASLGYLKKR